MSSSLTHTDNKKNTSVKIAAEESSTIQPPHHHRPFYCHVFLLLSVWSASIVWNGIEPLSYDYWVPLPPGIGYLRWDLAIWVSCFELWCLYRVLVALEDRREGRIVTRIVALLLCCFLVLIAFAGMPRPPYFVTRSPVLFQFTHTDDGNPFHCGHNATSSGVTVLPGGFNKAQSHALAHTIYQSSVNWTHRTASYGLAHHYYGTSLLHDDQHDEDRLPLYSLAYGFGHYTMERAARESLYRMHFPDQIAEVQQQLREHVLPLVRPMYAQAVNATSERDIVFGEDYRQGLGLPTVQIRMPNLVDQWWVHPQTNTVYPRRFRDVVRTQNVSSENEEEEESPNRMICHTTNHHQVQTFVLPLIIPYGAGLRQWTKDPYHSRDVYFQYGKMYRYPTQTVHAVLSSSRSFFPQWHSSRGIDMRLEAFGIPCDDGRWIFFH